MQEKEPGYQVEITELNQENMHFTVENHKPVNPDVKNIEKELFRIFEKYKSGET